jgi:hypothetical protein
MANIGTAVPNAAIPHSKQFHAKRGTVFSFKNCVLSQVRTNNEDRRRRAPSRKKAGVDAQG